jgi:hypothetical protein
MRYPPYAFTQEGVAMLSGLLNSDTAIDTNIKIMRAFVAMRQYLLNYAEIKQDLEDFKDEINVKFDKNDARFKEIFRVLDELIRRKQEAEKPRTRIGYKQNKNYE